MLNYSYDKLASSVRMKDMTSCASNRAVLHRIKNNDPSFTDLYIVEDIEDDYYDFIVREGDDLGWLGYFIGKNETLKTLYIADLPECRCREQVKYFFIGLQRNKSIKDVDFYGYGCGESLSAVNLPHVTTMSMGNLDHEEARSFAVGLQRCKSLVTYDGPVTSETVKSLTALPMLERVCFRWSEDMAIGREECVALRGLPVYATNMKELDICFNLGNEGLTILAEGLACNTKLQELRLTDNNIGDAGLEALADSLACNRTLRVLSIARTDLSVTGASSLSRILESGTSGLQDLRLDGVNISYEGWNILSDALSINNSLVSLSLQNWWGVESIIGDDELRALALGLSHNSHLKSLNLSGNSAITASGLLFLEDYFGSPSCALEDLSLFGINFGDEGARALDDALRRNSSLKTLYFDERGITLIGWKSFLNLICDTSSPNSLYLSNQTLCSLSGCSNFSGSCVKNDITRWLTKNKVCQTPKLAAKTKILHFFPDLDMVPLFQWDLKLLPLLKRWFNISSTNKAFEARIRNNELSCIYKFVRASPVLVKDNLRRNLARQVERIRAKISKLEEEERRLMQG